MTGMGWAGDNWGYPVLNKDKDEACFVTFERTVTEASVFKTRYLILKGPWSCVHICYLSFGSSLTYTPSSTLSSQVVSLPLQSVIQVAKFCASMDTLMDQDAQVRADWLRFKPVTSGSWQYIALSLRRFRPARHKGFLPLHTSKCKENKVLFAVTRLTIYFLWSCF